MFPRNVIEHDESEPQMLPFGCLFSDGVTAVLWAPSLPEGREQAYRRAAELTAERWAQGPVLLTTPIDVVSVEEIHPDAVDYWPQPKPDQIGTDPEDEAFDHWKSGGAA